MKLARYAAFVLLAACSAAKEKAADEVAEKIVEAAAGGNVDIEQSGDKLSIQTADGSAAVQVGAGAQLPENFPKDVPVYPGANIVMAAATNDGARAGFQLMLETPDGADKVTAFYKANAPVGLGVKAEMDMGGPKSLLLASAGDERQIALTAVSDGTKTTVTIGITSAAAK